MINNIIDLCEKFTTLASKTKKQDKLDILQDYSSDHDFCFLLEYLLNENKITGIKKSKLKKEIKKKNKLHDIQYDNIKSLIEYLLIHNTGSDQDVFIAQNFLNKIEHKNERQIIADIITKDFKCGVTDLTAYGIIPGIERNWRERKGHSLTDAKTGEIKTNKILDKNITVTLKLDGYRYKIIKQEDDIKIYSSSGKIVTGLIDIESEAKTLPDGVYDGEMIASGDYKDSTARFNATTKILGTDGTKIGVNFICFDYLRNIKAFLDYEEIALPRYKRLNMLQKIFETRSLKHIEVVPVYLNNIETTEETIEDIYEIYESKIGEGEEGLIVDLSDASYIRAKGTSMFKLKPEVSGDFKVIDVVEGKGKDAGRLGAFIIEYKNNTVHVGSGLTDAIREQVWSKPDDYIGKLIEVVYFGETQDEKTGLYSLRLPRFKRFRHDKNEVSYD